MIDALETIFVAVISVAVPVLLLGLIALIVYAIYREVRGSE
jgi:ABC-type transport system involved in cytochrome c biogenesis permease subunit